MDIGIHTSTETMKDRLKYTSIAGKWLAVQKPAKEQP